MPDRTGIEWTDATWNPVTGCTKVSPGCAHCYAEAITLRFKWGGPYLPGQTSIQMHPDRLDHPGQWRRPRRIFVNSMSDLFHEELPFEFIQAVFGAMERYDWHTYQVLTKRPEQMLRYYEWTESLEWPANVWIGVSVENQYWARRRIPLLQQVPAAVKFLSCEPLLKAVDLTPYLHDIQWVIVGGESGPHARPLHIDWIRIIRDRCKRERVPFFLKQLGGHPDQRGHEKALLDGRLWREMPASLSPTSKQLAEATA